MRQPRVLDLVKTERRRQRRIFGDQHIGSKKLSFDAKLRILVEEVGEVAKAIDAVDTMHHLIPRKRLIADLRTELVQVAACAVGMLESL